MGLTYHPKTAGLEPFDVNLSGADLLGLLHKAAGATKNKKFHEIPDDWTERVKYRCEEQECFDNAVLVEAFISTSEFEKLWKQTGHLEDGWGLHADDLSQFTEWCSGWVTFLKESKGYDTEPEHCDCALCKRCRV